MKLMLESKNSKKKEKKKWWNRKKGKLAGWTEAHQACPIAQHIRPGYRFAQNNRGG
jgi:hypothetical protein